MLEKFGLPYRAHSVGLYAGTMKDDMAQLAPAKLVPVLRTPEGDVIGESIAMAETLAERHPTLRLWPADSHARARARWLCSEMATGFTALRDACPMQLQHVNSGFDVSDDVQTDLKRLELIWNMARDISGASNGWLFGDYSLADVFFAPVAARIIGYDLKVSEAAQRYVELHIADPAFKAWRADGLKKTYDPFPYPVSAKQLPWPETGPARS